ncbi:small glutamine-rich tetratricopeptide repeat-containing protein beta [Magallana gigas]|uniref:SGTA homodimerisation domain-containing protein n=2 Tax=Magallana gigas TaxID=29159 RepID=A0A8W8P101_MAGGI|nr:small glutamine-rich tetratricopeptide repeat-containing protein beta [Crassostrea gigas]XP_011427455.1 small glutamine-rich tetratricopeptide repeat-containing protein beta [Crassostrea gigas]XP_034313302.1 small glutamine-rich tetratricopeptide repeat-containing protein beta-like [Crassostrea gigas]XP_034313304.1 small glutamine-rich tetratricopeptide repeat-containing protein beta-like [Crassostrea gigas]|eukprot:XP_011427454.1 PREDICTED: small glutamine-rich tetratricopeptide repeat-containing protein beta [Crassostrea gigas]
MADVNKLAFSIVKFLKDQTTQESLSEDAIESLEVAIQCLESAYSIDTQDESHIAKYQVQRNLLDIFNSQISSEPESDFSTLSLHEPTPEEKEKAEKLKNEGNNFMKEEKFSDALECYSQAVKLDNKNSVYYCNRAAAYSKLNKHVQAIEDCERALNIDPQYSKAYGRMGIAYTALTDHESARECYRKALELDPTNQSYQNNLEIAEQKLKEAAMQAGFNMGPMGMGNMDFSQMLNNPALMNMAQSMMQNPNMQQMMANFMSSMSGGGATPEGGPPGGMNNILEIGQQLAQQMEQTNPELVTQLRTQFGRGGPPNSEGGDPSQQNGDQSQPPK